MFTSLEGRAVDEAVSCRPLVLGGPGSIRDQALLDCKKR